MSARPAKDSIATVKISVPLIYLVIGTILVFGSAPEDALAETTYSIHGKTLYDTIQIASPQVQYGSNSANFSPIASNGSFSFQGGLFLASSGDPVPGASVQVNGSPHPFSIMADGTAYIACIVTIDGVPATGYSIYSVAFGADPNTQTIPLDVDGSFSLTLRLSSAGGAGMSNADLSLSGSSTGADGSFTISGTAHQPITGLTVSANNGSLDVSATTAVDGAFTLSGFPAGPSYTVTPVSSSFTFVPPSQTVPVSGEVYEVYFYGTTALAQTIQFTAPASGTYGDAPFEISASSTSGNTVAFSSLTPGVCSISGVTITIVSAGTCTIQGTADGNARYQPVTASTDITIDKKPLTITAVDQSKTYGQLVTFAGTEFTAAEMVSGDGITSVTLASDGAATAAGVTGSPYPIQPSNATGTGLDNYTITYARGWLTVTPADQVLNFDLSSLPSTSYGDSFNVAPYASSASSPAISFAVTSGPCSIAGTTVTGTGAGQCTIEATQAGDANYAAAAPVDQTLTISHAVLDVRADSQTKVYGALDPVLTFSSSGYKFTDSEAAVLTGALSRAGGETVTGGPYAIDRGTLAATENYTISFTGSTLTITLASLTVTADPQTKSYGQADPPLSYQVSGLQFGAQVGDVLSGSLVRAPGEDAADYAVTQGGLALTTAARDNYSLDYQGNTLTINPADLTITAEVQTKIYGEADPELTFQISSGTLFYGDQPSGSLAREPGEDVGTYAIQQGNLALGNNYHLSYVGADLTILAAISGTIQCNGQGLPGAAVTAQGEGTSFETITGDDGAYILSGLPAGNYTVTPVLTGYVFSPDLAQVTITTSSQTANFTATPHHTVYLPLALK